MKRILLFLLLIYGYQKDIRSEVRLPQIFADSMVLQRDKDIVIWGWADVNEKVVVRFRKQERTTYADKDGKWKISFSPESAQPKGDILSITGKNSIAIKDVLVGDVWICSGQSNMEWPVKLSSNADEEIRAANFTAIRHFYLPKNASGTPLDDVGKTAWQTATSGNVEAFTAVGYYFAREIHLDQKIPIGIINTSWGGTDVETWISAAGFKSDDMFSKSIGTLPILNVDSLQRVRETAVKKNIEKLQPKFPQDSDLQLWKDKTFDDSRWPQMKLPGNWEQQQLSDVDGVVWFRRKFDLTGAEAGRPVELHLGKIDDSDETYVNGVLVGKTELKAGEKRIYNIPCGLLIDGSNSIAVRVTDVWGGGGFYGDETDMKLVINQVDSKKLDGLWSFQVEKISPQSYNVSPNHYPSLLYNGMIHPLINLPIKGVIWYQGENNAGRAHEYRRSFPLLISDWRNQWNQGDFPFYFVQLSSFIAGGGNSKKGSSWAELREAQAMTLNNMPQTGMAVTVDIGETNDIHPKNKQDVGKRLAANALHFTYQKNGSYRGPVYQVMHIKENKATLLFSQTGSGLMTKNDTYGYVKGFEIAGEDKIFYYARAFVDGHRIVLEADEVKKPVAVRYGWADDASDANLYNKEGFPAEPFRTDNWKGITEAGTYNVIR